MNFLKEFSGRLLAHRDIKLISALCVGAVLLLVAAVMLSGTQVPAGSQTAGCFVGICWSDGGKIAEVPIYSFSSTQPYEGEPATLSWHTAYYSYPGASAECAINGPGMTTGYWKNVPLGTLVNPREGSIQTQPISSNTVFTLNCTMEYQTEIKSAQASVTVIPLPRPSVSVSIYGNNTNPTTVLVGEPVYIDATFMATGGESLLRTAIQDNEYQTLAGVEEMPPGNKSYVFTPTTAGTYVFYPAVQTLSTPEWQTYGKSLYVNVTETAECKGAHEINYPACTCESGYVNSNNVCIPATCGDPHMLPPACTVCQVGYVKQGGSCNPVQCADANALAPTCSVCRSGYVMQEGVCTVAPAVITITATPTRVRSGQATTLNWNVTGLVAGQGCAIAANPSGVFARSMPAGTAPSWGGSGQSSAINSATTFTLTCTGGASRSTTVSLIPTYQEI